MQPGFESLVKALGRATTNVTNELKAYRSYYDPNVEPNILGCLVNLSLQQHVQ